MSFTKRPREETTVTYQGRRVSVLYYVTLNPSSKRFKVNFKANGGQALEVSFKAQTKHHDTLTEAEVQAAVLANLQKRKRDLPPAEEAEDPDACAVDAEGGEGEQGTRVCDSVCVCILCMVGT